MDPSSSSSPYSTPDISSVPFPRQPRPRFGPRSPSQRPTALIVSDLGPPALHQRHHTEPALVNYHGFDAELDAAEHSFFDVPYSFAVSRPSSPAPTDYSLISPPLPDPESDPGPQAFRRRRRHRRFHTIYDGPPSPRVMKRILPRLWGALSSPARKSRTKSVSAAAFFLDPHLSYADLPPLDGEEGELVDDEACFMGSDGISAKSGIDVVSMLPSELCILVFRHLDLASILACQRVNREWRRLADDNAVWRDLFFRRDGWHIDLELAQARGWTLDPTAFLRDDYFPFPHQRDPHSRLSLPLPPFQYSPEIPSPYATPVFLTPAPPSPIVLLPSPFSPERPTGLAPMTPPSAQAPLTLPWRALYRTRQTLDDRWASPAFPPQTMRLTGHTNSVYCVEFDSARIVTGARDHTVRVWRIADGACLGTFHAHTASVLCLKFEKDWDVARPAGEPGLLVTGSSDRTVRVWDMRVTPSGAVEGTVRGVLEGHRGGVLDLRVDERWIVSSSKDARVCVWDRSTLALHRTLVGHEGPVNSIAMQAGRLVSASGDGRIMFWDAASGECLRVFDHLRGLACVEYKGDLIVSGSNDAKIKVWSASTGECVRTLAGHSDLVRALAFDPDSGRLVSASYDMSVRVWDVREGRLVREFLRHQGSHILDVKFDARKIVSVSFDKTILVTDFSEGLDAELFV